jgi:uncharacterized membrane protein YedE/YeeE
MEIVNFTPYPSLIGGILIGLAAIALMLFNGKISGISGITKGIMSKNCPTPHERKWRTFFTIGLVLGGIVITFIYPEMTAKNLNINSLQLVVAGLLVGFGTSLGNGCTSGHGVCGLGRRSMRSLYSVITFIASGMVTVYFMFHVFNIGV